MSETGDRRNPDADADGGDDRDQLVPQRIDCIDCGGVAHLLTRPDDTGRFWPGDLVVYRCEDCLDRWDLIVPEEDGSPAEDPDW